MARFQLAMLAALAAAVPAHAAKFRTVEVGGPAVTVIDGDTLAFGSESDGRR